MRFDLEHDGASSCRRRKVGIAFDKVTITYRGATYEIGRGRDFYGIWTVGGPRSHPLEWWPETAEGWSAAWSKFTAVEAPGTIAPVGRRTPPIAHVDAPAVVATAPLAERSAGQGPASPGTAVLEDRTAPYAQGAPFAQGASFAQGSPFGQRFASGVPHVNTRTGTISATLLLAVGVIIGIAGLFPDYLAGSSLVQHAAQVVPHAIYLAVWTASAVLILLGGVRLRLGALLAAGMSVVAFGLFFADAGTAIAGGGQVGGWGLWLSLVGWCALAPFEVFHPWWGRGYYGGGFNRGMNITNVNVSNVYRNSNYRNGISAVSASNFQSGRFNNVMRTSGAQVGTAGVIRGQMPFTASSANMRFSDRQASVIPRGNTNARMFTQQQPNPVQRGQVNQGIASRGQNSPAMTQSNRGQSTSQSNDAGWRRFGSPSGQPAAGQANQPSANRNGSGSTSPAVRNSPSSSPQGGWQRFGAPGGSGSAPSQGQSPAGSRQNYGSSPNNQGQRYNAPSGGSRD